MTLEEYKQARDLRQSNERQVVYLFAISTLEALHNELMGLPQNNKANLAIGYAIHSISQRIFDTPLPNEKPYLAENQASNELN